MPSKYIQDAIIDEISRYSGKKDLKIIDISCGDGSTLKRLSEMGYINLTGTLYGADEVIFNYSKVDYENIKIVKNVNLLEKLPLESESFDVVFNTELLEHLENHRHAVSELSRIVKTNGLLIIETPNIMRLPSRLNFFLSGFHKPRTPFPQYNKPLIEHLNLHSFPGYLPIIDYFFYKYGLRLKKIKWNKWRVFPIVLYLVFLVPIIINTLLFLWKEKGLDGETKKHFFKMQLTPAILICSVLILAYEKHEHVE